MLQINEYTAIKSSMTNKNIRLPNGFKTWLFDYEYAVTDGNSRDSDWLYAHGEVVDRV